MEQMNSPESKPQGSEQPELPPSLNIFEAIERLFSLAGIAQEPGWDLYDSNIRRKLDEVRERMQELYSNPLPTPSADEEVETPRTNERCERQKGQLCGCANLDLCRQLERELTQLRQQHNAEREEQRKRDVADDSIVASCNCLTKTPDIQHHALGCKYRLITERDTANSRLEEAEKLKQEVIKELNWLANYWCDGLSTDKIDRLLSRLSTSRENENKKHE